MYTYNLYIYGHKIDEDPELNSDITHFFDGFNKVIDGKEFEVSSPYHGGRVRGDIFPVIFGHIITDDDHNTYLIDTIRNFKEEDYEKSYSKFIDELMKDINSEKGTDDEYDLIVDRLQKFISNNKPQLYSVEVSS